VGFGEAAAAALGGALRFSPSRLTTPDEVEHAAKALAEAVAEIEKVVGRG